jgi:hypothetical protein
MYIYPTYLTERHVGNTPRGILVGVIPPERGAVVPAPGVLAPLQRCRVVGPDYVSPPGALALGPPPLLPDQVESGRRGRKIPARYAAPIQVRDDRPRGVRLHEGHRIVSSR